MSIINRSLDSSEQTKDVFVNIDGTVTGAVDQVYHVPHSMTIQSAKMSAVTLSGAPTCQLGIKRFVTGAGETTIALGPALTLVAVSTSGPQSFSFSSTALMEGDLVVATQAGTNAAAAQLGIALVVKATQDIKTWNY